MSAPRTQFKTKPTTRVGNNANTESAPKVTKEKPKVVGNNSQKPKVSVSQKPKTKSQNLKNQNFEHKGNFQLTGVPRLRNTDPLPKSTASWVHPRKEKDLAELIQSRLKKKSPWYDSIMRPINGGGVKIPDPVGTNTGTYQHVQNYSLSVNPNGIAGLRVVCPYINGYNQGSNPNGSNFQVTNVGSTSLNLGWSNAVTTGQMISFTAIPALMKANALSHRVVSACVTAQAETSTLNDAGEMVAFVTPFRCRSSTIGTATYNSAWDSSILPINAHKPICARHYPLSSDWDPYDGNTTVPHGEEVTASYQDFIDPNFGVAEDDDGVIPWEFGVVCSGMNPSIGVVRFQIIVNYEFIPLTSTAMVTQASSPIDPFEENFVLSRVASEPMTGVVSQKQASSAPSDSSVPVEETGFGLFADVVKQIVPLALEGLAML